MTQICRSLKKMTNTCSQAIASTSKLIVTCSAHFSCYTMRLWIFGHIYLVRYYALAWFFMCWYTYNLQACRNKVCLIDGLKISIPADLTKWSHHVTSLTLTLLLFCSRTKRIGYNVLISQIRFLMTCLRLKHSLLGIKNQGKRTQSLCSTTIWITMAQHLSKLITI